MIYDELDDVQHYLSLWNRILPAEFCWRQSSRGWCPCLGHGLDLSCTRPSGPPSPPGSHLYWSEELWFQPMFLDERRQSRKQVLHLIKLTHLRCLIEKKKPRQKHEIRWRAVNDNGIKMCSDRKCRDGGSREWTSLQLDISYWKLINYDRCLTFMVWKEESLLIKAI